MNSQFKHFLITRFNLPNKGWQQDKNNNPVQNEEWLYHRIELFETYCLPSISNQTCRNFIWLVYFNSDSPQFLVSKIEEWKKQCKELHPCFSDDYDAFLSHEMSDKIQELIPNGIPYVITTRLDNDDALHANAISVIQQSFTPKHNTIIDIEKGYCIRTSDGLITKHRFISNAFISYIESTAENFYNTVYKEGHPAWIGKANFISITNKRLWLQVIHEKNVANSMKGSVCLHQKILNNCSIVAKQKSYFTFASKQKIIVTIMLIKHFIKQTVVVLWKLLPYSFRNSIAKIKETRKQNLYNYRFVNNKIEWYIASHLSNKNPISIIDIGANKGGFIKDLSKWYTFKKVILIEPIPEIAKQLSQDFPNYTIFPNVITNISNQEIEFNINGFSETSSIFDIKSEMQELSRINTERLQKIKIPSKTLDEIYLESALNQVDLLKIDVQGAEHLVIAGGKEALQKTKYIWIELSFKSMYENTSTFQEIYELLEKEHFILLEISPGFKAPNKELMQADALFCNTKI